MQQTKTKCAWPPSMECGRLAVASRVAVTARGCEAAKVALSCSAARSAMPPVLPTGWMHSTANCQPVVAATRVCNGCSVVEMWRIYAATNGMCFFPVGALGVAPRLALAFIWGDALCGVNAHHVAGNGTVRCAQNGIVAKGIVPGSGGCLHQAKLECACGWCKSSALILAVN